MQNRKWVFVRDPLDKSKMSFVLGSRETELPSDALISVTRLEGMNVWRMILNNLANLFVMRQLKKNGRLIYAELTGSGAERGGNTLSVWHAKEMVPFRDSGAHRAAMKYMRWIFGGNVESYFLTWRANGRIPTYDQATEIIKKHGKHYTGNRLVSTATRPDW